MSEERLGLYTAPVEEWVAEFMRLFSGYTVTDNDSSTPFNAVDSGLLLSWFANLMQSGAASAGSIPHMQGEVLANNIAHGWFDKDRTFGDDIALLHSEVSEMLEAWREHGLADVTDSIRPGPHPGELIGTAQAKPEGVGSEVADLFIRLLDFCQRYGVNLAAEYQRKMAYNKTRPHRHGGKAI